jgi:hypothetical protein
MMELFEAKLAQSTAPETKDIVGAIALVVKDNGIQAQETESISKMSFNSVGDYSLPSCIRPSILRR